MAADSDAVDMFTHSNFHNKATAVIAHARNDCCACRVFISRLSLCLCVCFPLLAIKFFGGVVAKEFLFFFFFVNFDVHAKNALH